MNPHYKCGTYVKLQLSSGLIGVTSQEWDRQDQKMVYTARSVMVFNLVQTLAVFP
jgi:hypothetical protein